MQHSLKIPTFLFQKQRKKGGLRHPFSSRFNYARSTSSK